MGKIAKQLFFQSIAPFRAPNFKTDEGARNSVQNGSLTVSSKIEPICNN
jgi:hypothetical protein